MRDRAQTLEISNEEFEVIEAALHTQSQILNVQASAGGDGALTRLNQVKRVLARVAQQRPVRPGEKREKTCAPRSFFQWLAWG